MAFFFLNDLKFIAAQTPSAKMIHRHVELPCLCIQCERPVVILSFASHLLDILLLSILMHANRFMGLALCATSKETKPRTRWQKKKKYYIRKWHTLHYFERVKCIAYRKARWIFNFHLFMIRQYQQYILVFGFDCVVRLFYHGLAGKNYANI